MKITRLLLLLGLLCMALSCKEPSSVECFVKAGDKDDLGRYAFSFDMTDSTCVYDLSLYTRIGCRPGEFEANPDMSLVLRYISPSGRNFEENYCIPRDSYSAREYFSADYNLAYRQGVVPAEYGRWQLYITVSEEDSITGLSGMGLRVARRYPDGSGAAI